MASSPNSGWIPSLHAPLSDCLPSFSPKRTLTDIMRKCEQVHSHIQTAEANGDSAILQERCDIGDLMTGIAAVIGMCELKPRVKSDLMYNINHNLIYELEHAGEVIEDPGLSYMSKLVI